VLFLLACVPLQSHHIIFCMSSGAGLKELRAGLVQACAHQIACEGDGAQLPGAKSACADALHSLLAFVASAPKDELSAAVRAEIDSSIFDDAATLKWHLLRGLQRTVLHRAYLGLPKSMEQTRRFLTKMPPKKMSEVLEEKLGEDLTSCTDPLELRWVGEVLTFMTGADRFKKDLGGFELNAAGKNSCRSALNRVKKQKQVLDDAAFVARTAGKPAAPTFVHERDFRLDDVERDASREAGVESIFERALSLHEHKGGGGGGGGGDSGEPAAAGDVGANASAVDPAQQAAHDAHMAKLQNDGLRKMEHHAAKSKGKGRK
jgi:hypothetical protein